jgi:hypothetical protein
LRGAIDCIVVVAADVVFDVAASTSARSGDFGGSKLWGSMQASSEL